MAIDVFPLVHVPPGDPSLRLADCPAHTRVVPETESGSAFTVNEPEIMQPVPSVYVTESVPGDTPLTIPDALPMVAMAELLPLQKPPEPVLLKAVVKRAHTFGVPVMGAGRVLTVTCFIAIQPVPRV